MKRKDFTPLIMWFTLLLGIIVLGLIRLTRTIGLWTDAVFLSLYILWMFIELRISKRDINTEGKKTSDSASCQLYGLGQALTILTGIWMPSVWRTPNIAHFVGFLIFLFGICYRLWAIQTLGDLYSHRVRTAVQHKIVASGPYRFTRHPAYAGMIIANAGICTYFFNWVTVCTFICILAPAIIFRIIIEERTLFGIEGYTEFAEKRRRLFPAIW